MRRAAKADAAQAEIVKALRKIGARPYYVKEPLDLIVGYRGANYLLEVKDAHGTLTKAQTDFIAAWPGQHAIVRTPEEAIAAIMGIDGSAGHHPDAGGQSPTCGRRRPDGQR